MFEQYLTLLPDESGGAVLASFGLAGLIGVAIWAFGTRFSRSLLTLFAVAVGAIAGMHLPEYVKTPLSGWALATLAALGLGISAYVLHRLWVGAALILLGALVAVVATWLVCDRGDQWNWPAFKGMLTIPAFCQSLWNEFSGSVQRNAPWTAGAMALLSAGLTWWKPRVAITLLYSMLGMSIALSAGLSMTLSLKPNWIDQLSARPMVLAIALPAMLLAGMLLQWRSSRSWFAGPSGPVSAK